MEENELYIRDGDRMVSEELNEAMWDTLTESNSEQTNRKVKKMETIDKNIIVCGIPHYDFVPTPEHPKTTPIIMNDNNNKNDSVQTAEQPTITDLIVTLACGRGSRIVSTLEKINDYIVIGLNHKADHAMYNLARNISKRIFENPTDRAIEEVYDVLVESASIIDAVTNIKQTNKPTNRGGVVYDACVQYAVSTVRGDILRSNRVVSALEGCALRLCVSRDLTTGTVIMSEALDKALNKVYAAVRSQAKTNGVDIGGKSNTATKTATKNAILNELLRIKTEDSYQFDVIIGEVRPLSGQ